MKKLADHIIMKKNMEMFADARDIFQIEIADADEKFNLKEIDLDLWREKVHQAEIAYMYRLEAIMVSIDGIMSEELKIGGVKNDDIDNVH